MEWTLVSEECPTLVGVCRSLLGESLDPICLVHVEDDNVRLIPQNGRKGGKSSESATTGKYLANICAISLIFVILSYSYIFRQGLVVLAALWLQQNSKIDPDLVYNKGEHYSINFLI